MDKSLYSSILKDINNLNFQSVINELQKNHDEKDIDYLYLRCYSEYIQKNYYATLDYLLFCLVKFPVEFRSEKKFFKLLEKVLEKIGKFDFLKDLKNPKECEIVLNKLALWQGYRYE